MSDSKEFKWTDELVKEFANNLFVDTMADEKVLNDFKQSKQPVQEYEILSFKYYGDILFSLLPDIYSQTHYKSNGRIGSLSWLLDQVNKNEAVINSVKRLSDGEVFNIGDVIELFGDYPTGSIDEFLIDHFDNTRISAINKCGYGKALSHCKKVKPKIPLFKDEMGNDVFLGDKVYPIRKQDWYEQEYPFIAEFLSVSLGVKKDENKWWYFLNEADKKQYILENKPTQVSCKEIKSRFPKYGTYAYESICAYLEGFFKSKINQ